MRLAPQLGQNPLRWQDAQRTQAPAGQVGALSVLLNLQEGTGQANFRTGSTQWTNPHIWIYLDVTAENSDLQKCECEMGSPNKLIRQG